MKIDDARVKEPPSMPAIPMETQWPALMNEKAMAYLRRYDSCTQALLWAFMEALQMEDRMVLRAGGAMQGGMMSSLTCGVHTAGLMILGMLVGREDLGTGLDGLMPIVVPSQDLVRRLTRRVGGHSCLAMTGVDFTDLEAALAYKLSEDHERCVARVGAGAEERARFLQEENAKGALYRPSISG